LLHDLAPAHRQHAASVQQVSADLGYESVTAFITMIRKALGKPPAKYLSTVAQETSLRTSTPMGPQPGELSRDAVEFDLSRVLCRHRYRHPVPG